MMQAKRVTVDGLVKIEVNGKVIEPVAFMTYRPDAREDFVCEHVN